ncbi:late secretory pathway protein AVL9 homolog [Clavelina lepadiformis]|uniref:late secretory pathway protein AVL9 homolog n=1 Tax=Clavelina lepadiformis TaxID=159417 RepID=UPI004041B2B5
MEDFDDIEQAVLHIVVVGFHHKKGCQVEFSHPPLVDGESADSHLVPEEWKYLPFLALPDGAHNYMEDAIYFHLPPRAHYKRKTTVYGVSCYRQISTHLLKRKDADVTRETVQKSVVVLSQLPIYGILHAKLQMITQAYFEEKDFAKNEILKELFDHVNLSLKKIEESQKYLGLSSRALVLKFQHKIVMLFKLLLLERTVLFHVSPVQKLVGSMMALLSLFPEMIDKGLSQCTTTFAEHVRNVKDSISLCSTNDRVSEDIQSTGSLIESDNKEDVHSNSFEEKDDPTLQQAETTDSLLTMPQSENIVRKTDQKISMNLAEKTNTVVENTNATNGSLESISLEHGQTSESALDNALSCTEGNGVVLNSLSVTTERKTTVTDSSFWNVTSETAMNMAATVTSRLESISSSITASLTNQESIDISSWNLIHDIEDDDDDRLAASFGNSRLEIKTDSPAKSHKDSSAAKKATSTANKDESSIIKLMKLDNYECTLSTNEYGFPLSIFTRGYLCFPYIALQQHGELTENLERGYVVGATNILFKTHTHLADVVVEIDDAILEVRDNNLKRLLHLSAADLRFADYLVSNVSDRGVEDVFLDATGWEGGDEWIQARFTEYLIAMLAISTEVNANPKDLHDFNDAFLAAWKQTQNYQVWLTHEHPGMKDAKTSHPFQAQYSVSDMRLRLHHNLQSSDRGRKIEDAVSSANQAVASTGKMVGNVLVSARSTVTSWWSNRTKKEPP